MDLNLTDEQASAFAKAIFEASEGDFEATLAEARAIYEAARRLPRMVPAARPVPATFEQVAPQTKTRGSEHVDRYTTASPRGPWYVPHVPEGLTHTPGSQAAVYRYWPVLTPDGGILMASTSADQERFCSTLNELTDTIAVAVQRLLGLHPHAGFEGEPLPEQLGDLIELVALNYEVMFPKLSGRRTR